jgi:gas vesicle protein
VKRAQVSDNTILYGVLGVGAIAGFVVALTSGSNSGPAVSAPTTTSIASTTP